MSSIKSIYKYRRKDVNLYSKNGLLPGLKAGSSGITLKIILFLSFTQLEQ